MTLLVRRSIFLLISFKLLVGFGYAQSLQQTISFADDEFDRGNYRIAMAEYNRAVFFDKGDNLKYLHNRIAESYFAEKQFKKAYDHYNIASQICGSSDSCQRYVYSMVNCRILRKEFKASLIDLLSIEPANEEDKRKQSVYLATIYFGMAQFDESIAYFYSSIDPMDSTKLGRMHQLFSNMKKLNRPNPKTAKVLSLIIPGTGQFYTGSIQDGLNSLLLTSSIITVGFIVGNNYGIFEGILTALPWYQRYYQGGFIKAEQAAIRKRETKRRFIYKEAIEILQR